MPRQSIEQITIGNNPPGRYAGGYIYSSKFDLGYSQNLDKLTISVVDGSSISLGSKESQIKIGDTIFKESYLISSETNYAPGQNICNYTFTNKSYLLDKIFVGLVKRHCAASKIYDPKNARPGDNYIPGSAFLLTTKSFKKTATCPECDGSTSEKEGNFTRNVLDGFLIQNNLLCMGGEQAADNSCDIPEVYYSFNSFLSALYLKTGFRIQYDGSYNKYEVNYTGTAREVLSNICRDIAADFYFDWTSNTLIIYDLQRGISVPGGIDKNNPYLASYSKSSTIENTYESYSAQFSFTPGGVLNSNLSFSRSLEFVSNKDGSTKTPDNLSAEEQLLLIGAILGKIDTNARKLFFMKKGLWERVGLINLGYNIDPNSLFENGFDVKTYIDFKNKFNAIGVSPLFYFFIEDTKLETYWQQQEESYFNNFGRYFYSRDPNPESRDDCLGKGRRLKISTTYDPDINLYNGITTTTGLPGPASVYYIEKEPTYCPSLDSVFFYGDLESFFPVYMDYAGQVRLAVLNALSIGAGQYIESLNSQGRLLFALVPNLSSLPLNVSFGQLTSSKNGCEANISDSLFINRNSSQDSSQDPCAGECEVSPEEEICNNNVKNCGISIVPNPGHSKNDAQSIKITYNGSSVSIVLPVRELYYGIETKDYEIKNPFASKSEFNGGMYGDLNINPMKANLISDDISSTKGNEIINQMVTDPEDNLNIKVIGIQNITNFPLLPQQGLSSLSMYIDENGSFADLSYRSRAPELPSKEVALQAIRPNKVSIRK
jgi:hypothetical protein